ncbi:glycosyltransferase family 39 protein [Halogeometricum borinquense]|uniref:Glycosyltransferase family 39 protein n=1 Tax=Halogeometricum borinquense TaxID=60847 RepID=A0A6C0UGQ5_9EURY|nr:glycosyltransferase family 39 protein [Halogeometricum borinquense]QIQ76370.1 glycosyltransferase family 39 protein [Halogeometricum borinquense]
MSRFSFLRLRESLRRHPERAVAAVLVAAVGLLVFWLALDLFPYHSVNDDEGVYLYQAAMLLEGKLFLKPGAIPTDAVRPWFFVVREVGGETAMYGKYSPVVPAIFTVGRLLGDWNIALGLVAAGNAVGVYYLGSAAFDRRVGLVAVVALAASPLFLLTSATFLSYAPATMLNLAFAVAYVRAARTDSLRWAVASGAAVGLAFFARPYTAVLFAIPFIIHTLAVLVTGLRIGDDTFDPTFRRVVKRAVAIAVPGALGVAIALGYNAVVTGDPLLFPYAAFAPNDGIGFGPHEILGYDRNYTPELAAETTVLVFEFFLTEWTPAGVLGSLLAVLGIGTAAWRWREAIRVYRPSLSGMTGGEVAAVVAGVFPAVFLGEAYFWGTLNGLRNELIDLLGPFYHFDALLPVSVFAAAGAVALVRFVRQRLAERTTRRRARVAVAVLLLLVAPVVVSAEQRVIDGPFSENRQRTESLAATYEPFVERASNASDGTAFDDALVFTPDPYGDWQAHPFQYLRSDPGFDGAVVYATDGSPEQDFDVVAATNRTPYRFTYRGEWTGAVRPVNSDIQRLRVLSGSAVNATTTVGIPVNAESVSVRIETTAGYARYRVPASMRANETIPVEWVITAEGARIRNLDFASGPAGATVPLPDGASEVDLVVTFVGQGGASVTYRQEATLSAVEEEIQVLWPPETRVCRLTTECGTEGTWVGPDGEYVSGVSVETAATASDRQ